MAVPRTRGEGKNADLNLLPVMNLVTILIPLLLMSAQLVQLAVIDSTLPAISSETITPPDPTETQFRLSLDISPEGFTLRGAEDTIAEDEADIPCVEGRCQGLDSYDYARLTELLTEIKGAHPTEDVIILVPHERIPYEVLVSAMDAARGQEDGLLFPKVTIAGGLSG